MNAPWETTELIESTAVSFKSSPESTMLHAESLQNPTEWRCDSPFFGSVLKRFFRDASPIGHGGDQKAKIKSRDQPHKKYRYCRFVPITNPSKCKRLRLCGKVCFGDSPGLKFPRMSSSRESADSAARVAKLGATRASARATGWGRIRRKTGRDQGGSRRRCGSR